MPNKISLNEKDIIRMYENGLTSVQIAKNTGVSKPTILRTLHKNNIIMRPNASHRKYEIDELSFSNINKDNCYWAGFIAADGNISGINLSVELNSIDEKHLLKLADFVRSNIGIYKRKRQRDFEEIEYSCFKIRSQIIINDLYDNFNIVPRKSLILEPPKISGNFIKHYIRGYFDGDGCIGFDTHFKLTFVGGSFNILKWIKENIEQAVETGDPTICVRDKSKTYCLSYHGNQVINILNWLYEDCGNKKKRQI